MDKGIRKEIRKIIFEGDWWDYDSRNPVNQPDIECEHEIAYIETIDERDVKVYLNWDRSCSETAISTPDFIMIEQDPDLLPYIIKGFGHDVEVDKIQDYEGNIIIKAEGKTIRIPVDEIDAIVDEKVKL